MIRLIKRCLIYQFLIIFVLIRFENYEPSKKFFIRSFRQLLPNYDIFIKDHPSEIFKTFLIILFFNGGLSILNFKPSQIISGFLTLFLSIIYVNPKQKIMKYIMQNSQNGWLNFIPPMEFLIIFSLGIAMLTNPFIDWLSEEPKVSEINEEKKIN